MIGIYYMNEAFSDRLEEKAIYGVLQQLPDGTWIDDGGVRFPIDAKDRDELDKILRLDEEYSISAGFLTYLDTIADFVSIDRDGHILIEGDFLLHDRLQCMGYIYGDREFSSFPRQASLRPSTLDTYIDGYINLQHSAFADASNSYYEAIRNDNLSGDTSIIDIATINGSVVVIIDSSKGIPSFLKRMNPNISIENIAIGSSYFTSLEFLGLIVIDMSSEQKNRITKENPDEVDMSVTEILQHELRHYNLALNDYLLAVHLGMHSSTRGSSSKLKSSQALYSPSFEMDPDKEIYRVLFGYQATRGYGIEKALGMLNETHSRYWQRQDRWFDPDRTLYSTSGYGIFMKLFYDADRQTAGRIHTYLYALHAMDEVLVRYGEKREEFEIVYREIGGLIGTVRAPRQLERFLYVRWKKIRSSFSETTTSDVFTEKIMAYSEKKHASKQSIGLLFGKK